MLGAMAGDVIGSVYEWNNHKSKRFEPLFAEDAFFTDDTVHTVAVMAALMDGGDIGAYLHDYTNEYPGRGYGGNLAHWAASPAPKPYGSFGNGSAMRVSPCAWWATSEEEALALAARSAAPTHNHPEGVKGAQAVALAIWLGRGRKGSASDREEIRERLSRDFGYDLGRTVDEIRPGYRFDETCQGSVPEALVCALEAESFEDAIRNAISIGGDSDTIAAITGSVAEGLWGVPKHIQEEAMSRLDEKLAGVVRTFRRATARRQKEAHDMMEEKVTMKRIERTNEAESREDVGATQTPHGEGQQEIRHTVPKFDEMVRATLASLRKRGEVASNQEMEDDIVAGMNLSEKVAAELHGEGPQTKVGYNAAWTRTWLRKIGAIKPAEGPRARPGVWTLTAKGRDVEWAERRAETEVKAALRRSQEEAKQKKAQESVGTTRAKAEQPAPASPETDDGDAEDSWKTELMGVLRQLDPAAFERLCQRLLHATGIEDLVVKGGPGDGGIDGTGKLKVGLVSFQVAFQAKRWKGTVGPAVIREMQGSMTGDVDHGIVITTGHFSRSAKDQAKAPGAKQVELVDGERLCELLGEHGLGVMKTERRDVNREWLSKV